MQRQIYRGILSKILAPEQGAVVRRPSLAGDSAHRLVWNKERNSPKVDCIFTILVPISHRESMYRDNDAKRYVRLRRVRGRIAPNAC